MESGLFFISAPVGLDGFSKRPGLFYFLRIAQNAPAKFDTHEGANHFDQSRDLLRQKRSGVGAAYENHGT